MFKKINIYIFGQIFRSCILIFFIFLSISWLLQLTRLLTLTNLIQIDILSIIYLSLFLIPNLLSVILPFILIFGILLCFIKLNKDREIIAIYSLGLQLKPIKYSIIIFSIIILIFYSILNLYISPKIYENYKLNEFELRNKIDFDKMLVSNFIKLNKNTTIDFKKNKNSYEDIFISFNDEKENIIFAKKGFIINKNDKYIFQLNNGFKISVNNSEIEKLEFENYVLNIENDNNTEFNNFDRNTKTLYDDIKNKNYLNISYKFSDIFFLLLIFYIFYKNNIIKTNFSLKNNIFFIVSSLTVLIINQLFKNSEIELSLYLMLIIFITLSFIIIVKLRNYFYE